MNREDTLQLDIIIQAFLRSKGYETADYACIVAAPGDPEATFITCMDPRTAIKELSIIADILAANLERVTQ